MTERCFRLVIITTYYKVKFCSKLDVFKLEFPGNFVRSSKEFVGFVHHYYIKRIKNK